MKPRDGFAIVVSIAALGISSYAAYWIISNASSRSSSVSLDVTKEAIQPQLSAVEYLAGKAPVVTFEFDKESGSEEPVAMINGSKHMGKALLDGGAEVIQLREVLEARLVNGTLTVKDVETLTEYYFADMSQHTDESNRARRNANLLSYCLYMNPSNIKAECRPEVVAALDKMIADGLLLDNTIVRGDMIRATWARGSIFRNHKVVERLKIIRDDVSSPGDARRADDILKAMERRLAEAAQGGSDVSKP